MYSLHDHDCKAFTCMMQSNTVSVYMYHKIWIALLIMKAFSQYVIVTTGISTVFFYNWQTLLYKT